MKTRLAILVALAATAGASAGAYAAEAINPAVPGNPGALLGQLGAAPVLFPSEQGAFIGIEVAKQLVESWILQNGCEEKSFDLQARTLRFPGDYDPEFLCPWTGPVSGKIKRTHRIILDGIDIGVCTFFPVPGEGIFFTVPEGRRYIVAGANPTNILDGLHVPYISGVGSYNIGSEMQELTTDWIMESPNSDEVHTIGGVEYHGDDFRGTIIKDYWRLTNRLPIPGLCEGTAANGEVNYFTNACKPVSTVIDYGYQQIQKHGYIAAKWWQQSQAWRQNGVRSGTFWKVARAAPFGDACEITVKLQGTAGKTNTANAQGFDQTGEIIISTPKADLVPTESEGSVQFCNVVDGKRQVEFKVKNQGGAFAPVSKGKVEFFSGSVPIETKEFTIFGLLPGEFMEFGPFEPPAGCFNGDCNFRITVDFGLGLEGGSVDESNEGNNSAGGVCIG